jgi:hypothetical protein
VRGVIEDIVYFGSHSVYHVRLPGGFRFMSNFTNLQRWAQEASPGTTRCGCRGATSKAWC